MRLRTGIEKHWAEVAEQERIAATEAEMARLAALSETIESLRIQLREAERAFFGDRIPPQQFLNEGLRATFSLPPSAMGYLLGRLRGDYQ